MSTPAVAARAAAQSSTLATSRSLPIALLRAREKVMGPVRKMLIDAGVTEQQWRVLRILDEIGRVDATALANQACLLLPSLTRILQTLVEKGYVTRTASKIDRRRQVVAISKAGRRLLSDNMDEAQRIANRIETRFGTERLQKLLNLLNELDQMEFESQPGTAPRRPAAGRFQT